jgi:carbonic anhydrase
MIVMIKKIALYLLTASLVFYPLLETNAKEEENAGNIINRLLTSDSNFISLHSKKYFDDIKEHQHPSITLLTCSDSRVQENIFEDDPTDKIFSVRNIGNQLSTSIGSVDYGVKNLHTKVLVIMGHSHCGAIKAAMNDYPDETFAIMRDLDHLFVPVRKIKAKYPDIDLNLEEKWSRIVEENVDHQVLLATKKYEEEVKSNKLLVIGIIDDFTNTYNSGEGRTIVVNINNIKDVDKIKSHVAMDKISKEMKDLFIKRLNK